MQSLAWNPWLGDVLPQMQPDYGQIEYTQAEAMVATFTDLNPMPEPAPIQPRFGAMKTALTLADVLSTSPKSGLREAETGQQGYGGPALGKW